MKAVIDRFEADSAIIILENGKVLNSLRQSLPDDAVEGSHLQIMFDDDQSIQSIRLDQPATDEARQRIQEKLERLRRNDHLRED